MIDEGQLTAKEAPSIPPKRCIGIWASKVFRLTTFLIVLYGKSQGMTGGPPRVTPPLPPPPAVAGCGPSPPDPTDAPPIPRWWTPGSPPTFNPAIYKFFN